jgi:hypothetical protein
MPRPDDTLTIMVSSHQLALLKKLDFPGSEGVLASAQETEEGFVLTGSRVAFDSLVGWVAGEANHARRNRRPRQTELLDDIADELEAALASHRRRR